MHYLGRGLHCTLSFLHSPQDTTLLQMPVGDWYKSLFFPALLPHTWQDSRSSPPSQTSYHRLKINWLGQFHGIRVDTIFEFNHHFSTSGFLGILCVESPDYSLVMGKQKPVVIVWGEIFIVFRRRARYDESFRYSTLTTLPHLLRKRIEVSFQTYTHLKPEFSIITSSKAEQELWYWD